MSLLASMAARDVCPAVYPLSLPQRPCLHWSPLFILQARCVPAPGNTGGHLHPAQPDHACQCCRPMFSSDRVHCACVCIISTSLDPLRLWTLCMQCLPLSMLQT